MQKQKIGIWGFGVVGKSVLAYLASPDTTIEILDKKELTQEDQAVLAYYHARYTQEADSETIHAFFERNSTIIPSPGIDLSQYSQYRDKIVTELDLFTQNWRKPILAITGTVGKTSIVHLLNSILTQLGKKVATGGNIGLGMLDLLNIQDQFDLALLELSSFQLEHTKKIAPDIAVITSFFANHLDRHKTIDAYFQAKAQIFRNQTENQLVIVPWELCSHVAGLNQNRIFFADKLPEAAELKNLRQTDKLYFFTADELAIYQNEQTQPVLAIEALPILSYRKNWLIIAALLETQEIKLNQLGNLALSVPDHRLELVSTHNGISFYNDSKSTLPESTLQAVSELKKKPIILLLGGNSKGINREPLIARLKNQVKAIICFGAEATQLSGWCTQLGIITSAHKTLDCAFQAAVQTAQTGDQILLSPAGNSYDLYKIYTERGEHFKQLVKAMNSQ